jgi:hypothetical protein
MARGWLLGGYVLEGDVLAESNGEKNIMSTPVVTPES